MPPRRPPRSQIWSPFLCTALGVWLYLRHGTIPSPGIHTFNAPKHEAAEAPLKLLLRQQNATIHLLQTSLAIAIEERGHFQHMRSERSVLQQDRSGGGGGGVIHQERSQWGRSHHVLRSERTQHLRSERGPGAVRSYAHATTESVASLNASKDIDPTANLSPWAPVKLTRDDWIVYLRIQKTGSQTLWLTLTESFDGRVWGKTKCVKGPFCGYHCERVLALAFASFRRDAKCQLFVRAHANLWDYSRAADLAGIPRQRLRWLAFLREPLARAMSEHEHVTHGLVAQFGAHAFGKAWDYNFTDRHNARLADWLNCPACRVGSNNRQTRFLAGLAPTGSWDTDRFDDDALLAAALRNLGHCVFVGILERFADSMLLLRETFPVELARFTSYSLALHPKRKRHETDTNPADLERLRDFNQLDMKLYKTGLDIFEVRWAAMLRSLPESRQQRRFVRSKAWQGTAHQRFVLS